MVPGQGKLEIGCPKGTWMINKDDPLFLFGDPCLDRVQEFVKGMKLQGLDEDLEFTGMCI